MLRVELIQNDLSRYTTNPTPNLTTMCRKYALTCCECSRKDTVERACNLSYYSDDLSKFFMCSEPIIVKGTISGSECTICNGGNVFGDSPNPGWDYEKAKSPRETVEGDHGSETRSSSTALDKAQGSKDAPEEIGVYICKKQV